MKNLEILTDECQECMGIVVQECFEKNEEYGFCDVYVQAYNEYFHNIADLKTEQLMKYHERLGLAYDRKYKSKET